MWAVSLDSRSPSPGSPRRAKAQRRLSPFSGHVSIDAISQARSRLLQRYRFEGINRVIVQLGERKPDRDGPKMDRVGGLSTRP